MPHDVPPIGTLPTIAYLPQPGKPKPNGDEIIRLGMAGHPIEIGSTNDYCHLFHVMDRMGLADDFRLLRKQTGPARWLVYLVPDEMCVAAEAAAQAGRNP